MVTLFRRIGPAGALALVALAFAAPSQAVASGCPSQPMSQTFLPWLDPAWHVPAPGGDLEGNGAEWTLQGGAAPADGNEPFLAGEEWAIDDVCTSIPARRAERYSSIRVGRPNAGNSSG